MVLVAVKLNKILLFQTLIINHCHPSFKVLFLNMFDDYTFTVSERFMRYVQIDTQSDPQSETHPTTEKQKDLSRLLVEELKHIGINDAHMDEWGYVYATIPSNTNKQVPVICFCAHVDTAPDASGTDVKPYYIKIIMGRISLCQMTIISF
jgi:tripeptide aminopeptidase